MSAIRDAHIRVLDTSRLLRAESARLDRGPVGAQVEALYLRAQARRSLRCLTIVRLTNPQIVEVLP